MYKFNYKIPGSRVRTMIPAIAQILPTRRPIQNIDSDKCCYIISDVTATSSMTSSKRQLRFAGDRSIAKTSH